LERGATDEQLSVAGSGCRCAPPACDAEARSGAESRRPHASNLSARREQSPKENAIGRSSGCNIYVTYAPKGTFGSVAFERAAVNVPMPFKQR